ncbi:MAG: hypothetical protein A2Y59_02120 [Chloroflexi bacterium RBG_13_52_14]|nr:MAG: hypothetical protein A2Y59_02120 [Chloroflexi bacterium RBG_13_52_14]
MYDAGKIIAGVIIFLILVTFPIWYIAATGQASYVPQLQTPTGGNECIESTEYMIDNHMILLDEWRTMVVREGTDTYIASDGKGYDISLTGTCLSCHNKAEFCDQCHNYGGVSPNCWSCHISDISSGNSTGE